MKKITILYLLISVLYISCSPKLIPNNKSNNSLLGIINKQIENKKISKRALIYLNDKEISDEELKRLNIFELKDFTEITFVDRRKSKNGVVNLTSFLDPKLDYQYYKSINDKDILNLIDKLFYDGLINKNPLLIISGKPLRGEEIASTMNNLKIEKVNLLKRDAAYQVYGIRAINGVIMIDPEY